MRNTISILIILALFSLAQPFQRIGYADLDDGLIAYYPLNGNPIVA